MAQAPHPPARANQGSIVPAYSPDPLPPIEALPTTQLKSPRQAHREGVFRWFRTVRGRVALTYSVVLLVLLVTVGVVLNVAMSRALYGEERNRLSSQARASVVLAQSSFNSLVQGSTASNCENALSYQEAFEDSVGRVVEQQPLFTNVYLTDTQGNILAPLSAAGTVAPYYRPVEAARLKLAEAANRGGGISSGAFNTIAYDATDADGNRVAVILIAEAYHSASSCLKVRHLAIGQIEFVAQYSAVQDTLARLHLILLLVIATLLILGIVIGAPLVARALRPLTRMTATAERIAQGDLSQRVRLPHTGDEIGQLANTFDRMIARIESAFAAQQASEERMRQFIADASHELRTPLTSIRGYVDVLLRGAKDDPETAEHVLHATQRESERMSRLVNDLLTLARLDVGRPLDLQPLDLIGLTGEAVDQARILAGEREVSLRTDGAGRLMVSADRDRLKQVLVILLDNALKYGRPDAQGWVRMQVGRSAHGAFVSVTDNGEGIAAADLPHLFDRFYRAQRAAQRRRSAGPQAQTIDAASSAIQPASSTARRAAQTEGSGLGLAIAQAIVRAHGGVISVQSRLGAGTTFTVQLPLASDVTPAPAPSPTISK